MSSLEKCHCYGKTVLIPALQYAEWKHLTGVYEKNECNQCKIPKMSQERWNAEITMRARRWFDTYGINRPSTPDENGKYYLPSHNFFIPNGKYQSQN